MTIYIRPDGTISGSNEPLPVKPEMKEGTDFEYEHQYKNILTAWKESCIDFEDQESGKWLACYSLGQSDRKLVDILDLNFDGSGRLKTDLIIENVDVETEEVNLTIPCPDGIEGCEVLHHRTVLRIKDKQ